MLVKRLLVTIVLLPVGLAIIAWGGALYAGLIVLVLTVAAWEYYKLFCAGGFQPAGVLLLGGTLLFALGRAVSGFDSSPWMFSLVILGSMTYHLLSFERGRNLAATDFAVTLAGVFYFGWIGAYLVSLRFLPEGKWWLLLTLPSVWAADAGAYFFGTRLGRHKLSPRLSPNKTWEGYLGGILIGTLAGFLFGFLWQVPAGVGSAITPTRGAILGFVLSVLTLLGDLGESMIKRQVGAKDSSNLLPGHGGVFDRIDSWLWAAVLSYYMIVWFFY